MIDVGGDLIGLAAVITSAATLIATLRSARVVKDAHRQIHEVNKAVNGRQAGEPTIQTQIQDIHDATLPEHDAVIPTLQRIEAALTPPEA